MRETRTTCAVEAYNGVLGRKIHHHGNFFNFVACILKQELIKSIQLRNCIESGGAETTKSKRRYKVGFHHRNVSLYLKTNDFVFLFIHSGSECKDY